MPKHKRVGNYELKETIGKGTFSKVKRAINTETGEVVAIKIININSLEKEGMEKQVKREILVLKNIKHKNVVQMIEVLKSVNHIYIVMELVYGGELFDKIVAAKRFDEDTARHYFHQLVEGIRYCHSQDVAHRDLKPENLLLVGDTLKISDFGLSGISRNNQMLNTICGTPHYVAPEVLSGSYDGKRADIWSLGIILFVMISGCHPFDGETVNELFKRIEALEFKYPPYFSKEVRGLLDKIIVVDPEARATIEDIITDAWFRVGYKPTGPITPVTSATAGEENLESAFQETNEVEVEEKKRKASVINNSGARGTDSYDQMNAFEIVTYLMKDKMNALIPNTTVKPTSCFIAEGGVDQMYNDIVKFFDLKKSTLKQKDNTFEFKAKIRNAKFGELEISVRILPLQKSLMICECYRIKGASLKYHDAVRTLTEQFASKHHKQTTPVSSSPAKPSFLEESPKPATTTESA